MQCLNLDTVQMIVSLTLSIGVVFSGIVVASAYFFLRLFTPRDRDGDI